MPMKIYKYAFRDKWNRFRVFFTGFHVEIVFFEGSCGLSFKRDMDGGCFHFAIPLLISLYLAIDALRVRKYKEDCEKAIGLSIFDWGIWWEVWAPIMSWSRETPRWRHGSWHPLDTLLGRVKHREIRTIEDKTLDVPMPEGNYPAHIMIKDEGWKRPRWFETVIRRAHIDMLVPIPFSGKGENSWDCGVDGTYGLCTTAKDIPEAVGKLIADALKTRTKRDGYGNWKWPTYSTLEQYNEYKSKIKEENNADTAHN